MLLESWLMPLESFLQKGGPVVWVILAFSVLMWALLIEGALKLREARRELIAGRLRSELEAAPSEMFLTPKRREKLCSACRREAGRLIAVEAAWVRVIVAILPLIGLLGTVDGMIESFDSLASSNETDSSGLTAGISTALLTTLAGLTAALSGVFTVYRLERAAAHYERDAAEIVRHFILTFCGSQPVHKKENA